jgi:predicted nucleic acid-binding protein
VPIDSVAILDACVLINILASGRAEEILAQTNHRFGICTVVSAESIYLRAADSNAPPEEVKLDQFLKSRSLTVYGLVNDLDKTRYVDYAAELDDGEAMSLALTVTRGFSLATDDRKARRVFLDEVKDPTRLLSTTQILRNWSKVANLRAGEIKNVLLAVSRRGRFSPRSDDPDFSWWSNAVI